MVNQNSTLFMNHRIPFQRISHVAIDGEVILNEIRFTSGPGSVGAPYAVAPPYPGAYPGATGGAYPGATGSYVEVKGVYVYSIK